MLNMQTNVERVHSGIQPSMTIESLGDEASREFCDYLTSSSTIIKHYFVHLFQQ